MNFHSATFGLFFLAVLSLYWAAARRRGPRTLILLGASYAFYGAFELWYLWLIAFSTLLDYTCGKVVFESSSARTRRVALGCSLFGNLCVLGFFKYYDWGAAGIGALLDRLGIPVSVSSLGVVVPVGLSFYTFQSLSYTISIYRRHLEPARNLVEYALFVSFFPQLVAGPIVRARQFLPQLERMPLIDRERFADGVWRFGTGLIKKIALADVIGAYLVDPVYAEPGLYDAATRLLAFYGFAFQIYYDFSGYSDMAIGLGRLLGFDLPENFAGPYRARSVTAFWQRWHLTLGSWVRDYVFFPLVGRGGHRSELRVSLSLLLAMVVIGLWHGAGVLWLVFGLVQGVALVAERTFSIRRGRKPFAVTALGKGLAWFLTFHFLVLVTGLCVRPRDPAHAASLLARLGDQGGLAWQGMIALAAGAALHFAPRAIPVFAQRRVTALPVPVVGVLLGLSVGLVAILVVGSTPFLYFQF